MKTFHLSRAVRSAIFQNGLFVFLLLKRELSVPQIFFLQAMSLIVQRGSEIPVSVVAIRFGRRPCISAGLFLFALVAALTPLTDDFVAFLSLFVIQGIALAFVGCDRALNRLRLEISDTAQSFVDAV